MSVLFRALAADLRIVTQAQEMGHLVEEHRGIFERSLWEELKDHISHTGAGDYSPQSLPHQFACMHR